MQIGDKVVYIGYKNYNVFYRRSNVFLKPNRVYEIIYVNFCKIYLINENGIASELSFNSEDFKLLSEYRDDLINEIFN